MTASSPGTPPLPHPDQLPDDPATLKQMVLELLTSLSLSEQDRADLRHQIDQLLRRLYGPRTERHDPSQTLLFEEMPAAAPGEPEAKPQQRRRCRPHGRRCLPNNLPRQTQHHILPQPALICPDCGQTRHDIGVDRTEQLEYKPASLFVVEHIIHKYACPCCRRVDAGELDSTGFLDQEAEPMPPEQSEPLEQTPEANATPSANELAIAEQVSPLVDAAQQEECPAPQSGVVISAPRPTAPIPGGLPGPGLLAHLVVSKYTDHLPLYRLERVYERQGVFLPRSTLCDWLAATSRLLLPLYRRMVGVVLSSRVVHTDDTTVKLQEVGTHRLSTARLWVYLGDAAHPYNVFDFTVNRQRDGPVKFLADYHGYLQADAFSGYDGLYLPDPRTATARIVEVACNAHARRKFYEARSSAAACSHQALAYYGQLYELERRAKDFSDEQRLQMRKDLSLPILGRLHVWLQGQRVDVLPKSPMGEAVGYALNNWTALLRYTEAGFLAIDNNVAEQQMKRVAIGRKNWLTVGSPTGGQTAAVLMSFTSTCQRLGVEPWAYLQDVLTRLPAMGTDDLSLLLPDRWQAERVKQG